MGDKKSSHASRPGGQLNDSEINVSLFVPTSNFALLWARRGNPHGNKHPTEEENVLHTHKQHQPACACAACSMGEDVVRTPRASIITRIDSAAMGRDTP